MSVKSQKLSSQCVPCSLSIVFKLEAGPEVRACTGRRLYWSEASDCREVGTIFIWSKKEESVLSHTDKLVKLARNLELRDGK